MIVDMNTRIQRKDLFKLSSTQDLTAIDLFSGCGGLSLGLQQAGFRVVAAVEVAPKAQVTYKLNHQHVELYGEDIREVEPLSVLAKANLNRGELDLLAGCPPCQGFSRLRTKNKSNSVFDERNNLIDEFLRFVAAMAPKCIMLENVPSLSKDLGFETACYRLTELGYKFVIHVLDAADYGVPQRRKRLIMLASRVHTPVAATKNTQRKTVRDTITGLIPPSRSRDPIHTIPERRSQAVKDLIALIPKNGGSRTDLPADRQLDCHKRSNGFRDVYGRMSWDSVSPTITSGCHNPSKGRFLHPSLNRTITLREAAMLQGFPEDYQFDVSHGKEAIALMIGNALPPPFIEAHARALRAGLINVD
jgi:DNA (cytosine-5)-methyltransferase 1